jgi:hypothetical protein
MKRRIVSFHKDERNDWVADLECGHAQHVRHRPPWINRPWVISAEGRRSRIGARLNCKQCGIEAGSEHTHGEHHNTDRTFH